MDTDVIVIGAGLSGLVAGKTLQQAGKQVIVLDKGRSVGGRMATRRIQNGFADHGAQFFTARTATFQEQIDRWLDQNLVYVWGHGWSDGSLKRTPEDKHARYAVHGGMNNLTKALSSELSNIQLNTQITAVHWLGDSWRVMDGQGLTLTSKAVILTPPVPQTLGLLVDVPLAEEDRLALARIEYGPCLCGLFVVDGDTRLPEPGAIQNFEETYYWMADNKAKGISPDERIITVHAEARYSRTHYDDADNLTLDSMAEALKTYLAEGSVIKEAQLKKWRYSVPITTHPFDYLQATGLPLFFAGDAFGGRGRVEGAYLSGLAAGMATSIIV